MKLESLSYIPGKLPQTLTNQNKVLDRVNQSEVSIVHVLLVINQSEPDDCDHSERNVGHHDAHQYQADGRGSFSVQDKLFLSLRIRLELQSLDALSSDGEVDNDIEQSSDQEREQASGYSHHHHHLTPHPLRSEPG